MKGSLFLSQKCWLLPFFLNVSVQTSLSLFFFFFNNQQLNNIITDFNILICSKTLERCIKSSNKMKHSSLALFWMRGNQGLSFCNLQSSMFFLFLFFFFYGGKQGTLILLNQLLSPP